MGGLKKVGADPAVVTPIEDAKLELIGLMIALLGPSPIRLYEDMQITYSESLKSGPIKVRM
jgi:hypothetical protein